VLRATEQQSVMCLAYIPIAHNDHHQQSGNGKLWHLDGETNVNQHWNFAGCE